MGTIVVKNAVERKPGKMYYIDGEGNLLESDMVRRKKKAAKKEPVKKKAAKKEPVKKKAAKK